MSAKNVLRTDMMVSNVPVGVYVLDVLYFDIHPY